LPLAINLIQDCFTRWCGSETTHQDIGPVDRYFLI